jgi:hypothetical protein
MREPFVAVDAIVAQRCIFIAAERKYGLVHTSVLKAFSRSNRWKWLRVMPIRDPNSLHETEDDNLATPRTL